MLAHLIAFGAFDTSESQPDIGTVNASADATVAITRTVAIGGAGAGIPADAFRWKKPLDPSDRALFAFDWQHFLDEGETVGTIEQITMSALGASLGVEIDDDPARPPKIDAANKKVGLWFRVDPAFQFHAAFSDPGTLVAVSMRIRTDADPFQEFERTSVLVVRQQ